MGLVRTDVDGAAAKAPDSSPRSNRAHGAEPVSMSVDQGAPGLARARRRSHCFRVECEDGVVLKARDIGAIDEARALAELRAGLDPAFVPILRVDGAVLVEASVDGAEADPDAAEEPERTAGALPGRHPP